VGRKSGLTEAKLRALSDFESSSDLTDLEKLVLRYSTHITVTPVEMPDDLFRELQKHFDNRQIVELTSAIAWENFRARFNHALGIGSEGFSENHYCPLPERHPVSSS
jgi:alkylhydroperoxidase family enzyme